MASTFLLVDVSFFFGFTPPSSLDSLIRLCARLLREPLGFGGKEVVFPDGSNPEPPASEEDALSTPTAPPGLN